MQGEFRPSNDRIIANSLTEKSGNSWPDFDRMARHHERGIRLTEPFLGTRLQSAVDLRIIIGQWGTIEDGGVIFLSTAKPPQIRLQPKIQACETVKVDLT